MLYLDDFTTGKEISLGHYTVSEKEIIDFAKDYDFQDFHTDPEAAKRSVFGGLIASGWHTAGICMKLICQAFMTQTACNGSPGIQDLKWLKPVRPGDTLTGFVRVTGQLPSKSKPDRGASLQHWALQNQDGDTVFCADVTVLMMRAPQPPAEAVKPADANAAHATGTAVSAETSASGSDRAELEKWRAQAQSLWFNDGSCTGGKSE
jgi:acyl dehydratase